jgi:hypothetical protein
MSARKEKSLTELKGRLVMDIHKHSESFPGTACGACIVSNCYLAYNDRYVTCSDCLEAMGEANSKQQSGTYTSLPIQPWHFAEVNNLSFLEGCIVKRVCRHRVKDGAKDLDKAIEELKLLEDHLYGH